uniref:Uncharacterized protein n=1 Tax=Ditylenchus dipsaci TaxID=166011 RepID=A0A915D0F4_9BILA
MESVSSSSPNHIHAFSPSFLNMAALNGNGSSLISSSSFSPVSSNSESSANSFLQTKGFSTLFPMGNFVLDNKTMTFPTQFSSSSSTPSPMSSLSSIGHFLAPNAVMPVEDAIFQHRNSGIADSGLGINQLLNSNDYLNYQQLILANILSQQQQKKELEEHLKNFQAFSMTKPALEQCSDLGRKEIGLAQTPVTTSPSSPISHEMVYDKLLNCLLKKPQIELPSQSTSYKAIENLMLYNAAISNQQPQGQ